MLPIPTPCDKCLDNPRPGTLGAGFNLLTSENFKCVIVEYCCPSLLNKEQQLPRRELPVHLTLPMPMWPRAARVAQITATHPFYFTTRLCTGVDGERDHFALGGLYPKGHLGQAVIKFRKKCRSLPHWPLFICPRAVSAQQRAPNERLIRVGAGTASPGLVT